MNVWIHGNIRLTLEVPTRLRESNGHSKSLHLFVFIRVLRGRIYIYIFSGTNENHRLESYPFAHARQYNDRHPPRPRLLSDTREGKKDQICQTIASS